MKIKINISLLTTFHNNSFQSYVPNVNYLNNQQWHTITNNLLYSICHIVHFTQSTWQQLSMRWRTGGRSGETELASLRLLSSINYDSRLPALNLPFHCFLSFCCPVLACRCSVVLALFTGTHKIQGAPVTYNLGLSVDFSSLNDAYFQPCSTKMTWK